MSEELAEEMRNVRVLLEKVLATLKLSNLENIEKGKDRLLRSKTKREVYKLCDGRNTVGDMVKALGTTQPNVSYHLSTLLESGLVRYEDIGGKRFYSKILE